MICINVAFWIRKYLEILPNFTWLSLQMSYSGQDQLICEKMDPSQCPQIKLEQVLQKQCFFIVFLCVLISCIYANAPLHSVENDDLLIKQAAFLIQKRQFKEAAHIYESLLATDSNNTEYLLQLGRLYVALNRPSLAISLYELALMHEPDRQDIRIALAFAFLFQNKLEMSKQLFQTVLAKDPYNGDVLAGLAKIEVKKGNLKEAEAILEKILKINSKNTTALIYFAQIRTQQGKYDAAYAIYQKILTIEPENFDAKEGLLNIRNQQLIHKAQEEAKKRQYKEAESIYLKLLKESPENVDYLIRLGNLYRFEGKSLLAIQFLSKALELDIKRVDTKLSLAFSHLMNKDLEMSRYFFHDVLIQEPNNGEALAGMGRVFALNNDPERAEYYYQKAFKVNPEDPTTLEFYGLFKLQKKQFEAALKSYSKLLEIDPKNVEYEKGFKQAEEGVLIVRARELEIRKNDAEALALYEYLLDRSPEKMEYLVRIGSIYVRSNRVNKAVNLYKKGLQKDPHHVELLNAIGFIYLNAALLEDSESRFSASFRYPFISLKSRNSLFKSSGYFQQAILQNPKNGDALAGLGRVVLHRGCYEKAKYFYLLALQNEPENPTALSYYASLQALEKKYFSGEHTYRRLLQIDPHNQEAWENYRDFEDNARPQLDFSGYYAEENEKDPILNDWSARLKSYGSLLTGVTPICDQYKLTGAVGVDYIVLKNLQINTSIYSLDVQKSSLRVDWNKNPYFAVSGGINFVLFSQYRHSTFFTKNGNYYLPFVNFFYSKNHHTFYLETVGDAPLVARNFTNLRSTLIARQFLNSFYEYDFGNRRLIGASASYAWYYNCIKNNRFQSGSAWMQMTPPCFSKTVALRYQFVYGRFSDLTVDYYTFRPQVSHWLKVDLTKKWFKDRMVLELGYGHCWQRSFESGQVINVVPIPFFHWVHREINAAYGRFKYRYSDCIHFSINGGYSKDSFDYTTASVSGNLHLRF